MPVFEKALHRLREATPRVEALATIFEHIGQMVDQFGAAASQLNLDWQQFDDEVADGDLIPYITLGVRPATKRNDKNKDATEGGGSSGGNDGRDGLSVHADSN